MHIKKIKFLLSKNYNWFAVLSNKFQKKIKMRRHEIIIFLLKIQLFFSIIFSVKEQRNINLKNRPGFTL